MVAATHDAITGVWVSGCPREIELVQIMWPIIPVVSQCQLVLVIHSIPPISTYQHLSCSWAYARTLHLSKILADRHENLAQFGQRDGYAGDLCLVVLGSYMGLARLRVSTYYVV